MSNLNGKELMKNINDIIDNCNCWMEDEEADEETIKWFKMEKETLLNLYNEIDRLQKELEYYKEKEESEEDDFDNRDRWE